MFIASLHLLSEQLYAGIDGRRKLLPPTNPPSAPGRRAAVAVRHGRVVRKCTVVRALIGRMAGKCTVVRVLIGQMALNFFIFLSLVGLERRLLCKQLLPSLRRCKFRYNIQNLPSPFVKDCYTRAFSSANVEKARAPVLGTGFQAAMTAGTGEE